MKTVALIFSVLGGFGSQVVLITALLYYLGWVRTEATLGYFGLDTTLVGYSTTDYVLRSLNATVPPLVMIGVVLLALPLIHNKVMHSAIARRIRLLDVGMMVGRSLAVVVSVSLVAPRLIGGGPPRAALAVGLVGSVLLMAYSGYLRSLHQTKTEGAGNKPKATDTDYVASNHSAQFQVVVLASLGVIGLLWTLALYAHQGGEDHAADIVADRVGAPDIVVYSTERLEITGAGVVLEEIGQNGGKYRYRYSGLRLIAAGKGKYVLLPWGWRKREDSAYVLHDDPSVRIDITAR